MHVGERLSEDWFLPCGKHGSKRREGGSVFLQGFELVAQLHHRLSHHGLLILVFALQVGQCDLSRLTGGDRKEDTIRQTIYEAINQLISV